MTWIEPPHKTKTNRIIGQWVQDKPHDYQSDKANANHASCEDFNACPPSSSSNHYHEGIPRSTPTGYNDDADQKPNFNACKQMTHIPECTANCLELHSGDWEGTQRKLRIIYSTMDWCFPSWPPIQLGNAVKKLSESAKGFTTRSACQRKSLLSANPF